MDLLENAKHELEELKRQKEVIVAVFDAKIAIVEQTVKLLEPVYRPTPGLIVPLLDDSVGITEAIEMALRKYPGKLMPPTAVRDVLIEMKYKIKGDNPMASVHQVLKRLIARAGSPYVAEEVDGQTTYKFDGAKEPQRARQLDRSAFIDGMMAYTDAHSNLADIIKEAERISSNALATLTGITIDPKMLEFIKSVEEAHERVRTFPLPVKMLDESEKK